MIAPAAVTAARGAAAAGNALDQAKTRMDQQGALDAAALAKGAAGVGNAIDSGGRAVAGAMPAVVNGVVQAKTALDGLPAQAAKVAVAGARAVGQLPAQAAIAATKAAAAGASGLDALNQPPAAPAAPTQPAAGLVAGPMTMKSFTGPMATPVRPGPNGLAPGPLDQLDTPLGSTSMTEDPAESFAKSPEDAKFKKKLAFSGGSEGK